MIARPQPDEYGQFYAGYIERVPEGADLITLLDGQPDELKWRLRRVTDEHANIHPAPGEWSIKEVVGHMADTERVFAYRALRIARGDTTPLPGFDQDEFVKGADFNARSLSDLMEEFALQRQANMLLIRSLTDTELTRMGTASDNPLSARAAVYILAGHVIHHIVSLKESYNVR